MQRNVFVFDGLGNLSKKINVYLQKKFNLLISEQNKSWDVPTGLVSLCYKNTE